MFSNGIRAPRSAMHGAMLALLTAAAVGTASAQGIAYTAKDVHLRAGPARDYPVVAILAAGVEILVEGCIGDYTWCDVVAGPNRGWVYAGNIVYPYQGANVPVLTYGGIIGLGIMTFSVGSYWDNYYRGRPWYAQRHVWIDHPPPALGRGVHRQSIHAPVVVPDNRHPSPHAQAVTPGRPRPPEQHQAPSSGQRPPPMQAPGSGQHSPRTQQPSPDRQRGQQEHGSARR